MKIEGKKTYSPVTITIETQEEFDTFWDGIEVTCELYRARPDTLTKASLSPFHKQLIDISNAFSDL